MGVGHATLLPAVLLMLAVSPSTPAAPGAKFSFRVPSLSGGSLSHEDFKGKILIVDVWATWCGPCRMVIPHLVTMQEKFKDKGVAVVGLNMDEESSAGTNFEAVRKFVQEQGINYPVGLMNLPTYLEVARVMGFDLAEGFSIPTTIVLGRDGMLIKRYPGYFAGQEQEIQRLVSEMIAGEASTSEKP